MLPTVNTVLNYSSTPFECQNIVRYDNVQETEMNNGLSVPVPQNLIQQLKIGSRSNDYISGHTAILLANRVFGFNGWRSEIRSLNSFKNDKNYVSCCVIRVTLKDGTFKEDVGQNDNFKYDTSVKASVTDALKRCLRQFGEYMGNSLYSIEDQSNSQFGRPNVQTQSFGENILECSNFDF